MKWSGKEFARSAQIPYPKQRTGTMQEPEIVCLCGSTRFQREYEEAQYQETMAGRIVLSVGRFGHKDGLDMAGPDKAFLDVLHMAKIDKAQRVLVINPPAPVCERCGKYATPRKHILDSECCQTNIVTRPYLGESTTREVIYALWKGKVVVFTHEPPAWWPSMVERILGKGPRKSNPERALPD
jgi:hypothetical protein